MKYSPLIRKLLNASMDARWQDKDVAERLKERSTDDTDLIRLHNYIGLMPMVGGHGVIDMDFLFETFPNEYYPFDFETYCQSGSRMIMVTSNALTGKAEYIEEYANYKRFVDAARASCSLPIMCPMGNVDGIPMVDGGVTDSIPFAHALSDGCTKAVVVMTKEVGYRKEAGDIYLPPMAYRKYPELREALRTRNDAYNAQLDALTQAEQSGQAYVIRPTHNCGVGRTTSDISKLEQLYDLGYNMALQQLNNINQFIGN